LRDAVKDKTVSSSRWARPNSMARIADAGRLAVRLRDFPARRAPDGGPQRALVTPAIPFGMSEHHMSLGGTLTLDYATMAAVIGCVVRSARGTDSSASSC